MEEKWKNINLSLDEIIAKNRNDYKFPQRKNQQQHRKNQQQQQKKQQHQRGNQQAQLHSRRRNQRQMQRGPLPKNWDYSQIWDNGQLNFNSGKFGNRLVTAQKGKPGGVIQVLHATGNSERRNRQDINDPNKGASQNFGNIYVEIGEDDSLDWQQETTNRQHYQQDYTPATNEVVDTTKNNYPTNGHLIFKF